MSPEDPQFPDTTSDTNFSQAQKELLSGDKPITLEKLQKYLQLRLEYLNSDPPISMDPNSFKMIREKCLAELFNLQYLMDLKHKPTTEGGKKIVILSAQYATRHFESLLGDFEENSTAYNRLNQAITLILAKTAKLVL